MIDHERYELALQASNEGVWYWDLEADTIHYSDRCIEFLGQDEATGIHIIKDHDALYHPEDSQKLSEALETQRNDPQQPIFSVHCRYRKSPLEPWIWLRICGTCKRNEAGDIFKMAGTLINISKRKAAELELENERHLLDLLVESVPVNIYFKDADSRFVMANTATATKMGLTSKAELIGKTDHDFFDAMHAEKSREQELHIMETGEPLAGSVVRETWDNKQATWIVSSKHPWRDTKGKIIGTFGTTYDVTDLVTTQLKLSSIAEELSKSNQIYAEEINLAANVQEALIQGKIRSLKAQDGSKVVFETYFKSMLELSGAFYEVIPLSRERYGILMANVLGNGVHAALLVSLLRGLMNKEKAKAESPADFLASLNHSFHSILARAKVSIEAKAVYIVVDAAHKTLRIANAGNAHPIVLDQEGQYLQYQGEDFPALGTSSETFYAEQLIEHVNECVFFTDGLLRLGEKLLSSNDIVDSFNNLSSRKSKKLAALIKSLLKSQGNSSFDDDVSLLRIRFKPATDG